MKRFRFRDIMNTVWLSMLEPPWCGNSDDRFIDWGFWIVGWMWTVAGLLSGALVAPTLVQVIGLTHLPYQDWLVIAIAVLGGFLVQVIGILLMTVWDIITPDENYDRRSYLQTVLDVLLLLIVVLLPIVSVGYGIYRYLAWVGSEQRTVTVAFVGALLIKTFAIPLIKGIVTGALFRWLLKRLRGGKDTKKAK